MPSKSRSNTCNTNETISVIIKSDSQSAIQAIKQFNNSHPIVNEIKEFIRSLSENVIFNIQWVRGLTGIGSNKRADTLANKGMSESIYNSFPLWFAKRNCVLTLFLHELIMLLHRNFNCRFDHVSGLAPLSNFPKIISLFLSIFERNSEKKLIRGGGQMIFWN